MENLTCSRALPSTHGVENQFAQGVLFKKKKKQIENADRLQMQCEPVLSLNECKQHEKNIKREKATGDVQGEEKGLGW